MFLDKKGDKDKKLKWILIEQSNEAKKNSTMKPLVIKHMLGKYQIGEEIYSESRLKEYKRLGIPIVRRRERISGKGRLIGFTTFGQIKSPKKVF